MTPEIHVRIHVERLDDCGELSQLDRIRVLRAQISLLRRRCEDGLPVTLDGLLNAERFARWLELEACL